MHWIFHHVEQGIVYIHSPLDMPSTQENTCAHKNGLSQVIPVDLMMHLHEHSRMLCVMYVCDVSKVYAVVAHHIIHIYTQTYQQNVLTADHWLGVQ